MKIQRDKNWLRLQKKDTDHEQGLSKMWAKFLKMYHPLPFLKICLQFRHFYGVAVLFFDEIDSLIIVKLILKYVTITSINS